MFRYHYKPITKQTNNEWVLQIVSVDRDIHVKCHDGKWTVKTMINNTLTDLLGLYVYIKSFAGIIPNVEYVQIVGCNGDVEIYTT